MSAIQRVIYILALVGWNCGEIGGKNEVGGDTCEHIASYRGTVVPNKLATFTAESNDK